jgi:hypothetical protein
VTLQYPIANRVALDLISCDSLRQSFDIKSKILELTQDKCNSKDSIIKSMESKTVLYKQQISIFQEKEIQYKSSVTTLQNDLKKQKIKHKIITRIGFVLLAISVGTIISQSL